jgi:LysR family transcriptional regulator, hypochlorite-specific transcription factor HypT
MRLEWLEDILAIAQTGSFSGAAERRNLTQSAFSRRIQQIEDHIGVQLFDRSRKPVQLRPTTLAQGAQIEHLAAALRQLVVDLRRGDRMASNRIVIASQHALTTSLAPRIIQGIQTASGRACDRLRHPRHRRPAGRRVS